MDFKIKFRPLRYTDAKFINDLRAEEEAEKIVGAVSRPVAFERDQKWIENIILSDNQTIVYYAVTKEDNDHIIGYISLSEIDYRNGSCVFSGIKLAAADRGKGFGIQATLKILKYVFEELRMERCGAECLEQHAASLKMMLTAGFKKEGLKRRSVFKNNVCNNQWQLSVIKEEYSLIKKQFDL